VRFVVRRLLVAVAGASLLAAAENASLPPLRLLALDVDARQAVIAVDATAPAVVTVGEPIDALPGYRMRRVLADRVVLEKGATAGAEPKVVWVHALRPGEERSRVQELLAVPPPETLDVRPQVIVAKPAAEGSGAGDDPRGKIVTVSPPPDAPEPPP
jgi:hypothetical protein